MVSWTKFSEFLIGTIKILTFAPTFIRRISIFPRPPWLALAFTLSFGTGGCHNLAWFATPSATRPTGTSGGPFHSTVITEPLLGRLGQPHTTKMEPLHHTIRVITTNHLPEKDVTTDTVQWFVGVRGHASQPSGVLLAEFFLCSLLLQLCRRHTLST